MNGLVNELVNDHKALYHFSFLHGLYPGNVFYPKQLMEKIFYCFLQNNSLSGSMDDIVSGYFGDKVWSNPSLYIHEKYFVPMNKLPGIYSKFFKKNFSVKNTTDMWFDIIASKEKRTGELFSVFCNREEYLKKRTMRNDVLLCIMMEHIFESYRKSPEISGKHQGLISTINTALKKHVFSYGADEKKEQYVFLENCFRNYSLLYRGEEYLILYYKSILKNIFKYSIYEWLKNSDECKKIKLLQNLRGTGYHNIKERSEPKKIEGKHMYVEYILGNGHNNYAMKAISRYSVFLRGDEEIYELMMKKDQFTGFKSIIMDSPGKYTSHYGYVSNKPYLHPLLDMWVYPVYNPIPYSSGPG